MELKQIFYSTKQQDGGGVSANINQFIHNLVPQEKVGCNTTM